MNPIKMTFCLIIIFSCTNIFAATKKRSQKTIKIETEYSRIENDSEQAISRALTEFTNNSKFKQCKVKNKSASPYKKTADGAVEYINDKWNVIFEITCKKLEVGQDTIEGNSNSNSSGRWQIVKDPDTVPIPEFRENPSKVISH